MFRIIRFLFIYFLISLKLLYTFFGTRQAVISDCNGLQNQLELYLDGNKISNIPDIESIVIVNIPSWAAGVKLWKCNESTLDNLRKNV